MGPPLLAKAGLPTAALFWLQNRLLFWPPPRLSIFEHVGYAGFVPQSFDRPPLTQARSEVSCFPCSCLCLGTQSLPPSTSVSAFKPQRQCMVLSGVMQNRLGPKRPLRQSRSHRKQKPQQKPQENRTTRLVPNRQQSVKGRARLVHCPAELGV